jgi:hypothetical protein
VIDHGAGGEIGDVAGAVGESGRLICGHPRRGVDGAGNGHGHGTGRFHPGVGDAQVGQADRVIAPPGQQSGQDVGVQPHASVRVRPHVSVFDQDAGGVGQDSQRYAFREVG